MKLLRKNRLGICDVCATFEHELATEKRPRQKATIRLKQKQHWAKVREGRFQNIYVRWPLDCLLSILERIEQTRRHLESVYSPNEVVTITMDGKAPLHLPHLARMPKGLLTKYRAKLQLYGIINSAGQIFEYVPYLDWWSHDANLAMSFLFRHLKEYFEAQPGTKKILYLQTDNCARDNKNR